MKKAVPMRAPNLRKRRPIPQTSSGTLKRATKATSSSVRPDPQVFWASPHLLSPHQPANFCAGCWADGIDFLKHNLENSKKIQKNLGLSP